MTVGQFKKFITTLDLQGTVIRYFENDFLDRIYKFYKEELDLEDIFDDYIVTAYCFSFIRNEISVFVKVD